MNCTLFLTGTRSIGSTHALFCGMQSGFDDPQTYKIIGAAMTVHRELGCGFVEAVSREAFALELDEQGIPHLREVRLPVRYKNRRLPLSYTVDFVCYGEILVELKALHAIGPIEVAQLINYLRLARRNRGLLLNFGTTSLQHKRIVLGLENDPARSSKRDPESGGAA
jgi:GxxExxY protein